MSGNRILLVGCQPGLRTAIALCLKDVGAYDVVETTSQEDVIEVATARPFDLILLNTGLRNTSGFEICRQLKASPDISDVPVIFISDQNSEEQQRVAQEAGGTDILTKPFGIEELLETTARHLKTRE